MAEIVLKNIVKRFGSLIAINNLNLTIKEKEFLVLLGPSGCGKTTTLRCISGLEIPDEGRIIIGGEDVTTKKASERDIAFVFQLYALYPHMTVYDNIAFPLINMKYSKKNIKKEIDNVVEILKIKHILNRKPRELSGGDMQRVALGRAIVRRPKAFLLDEPIGTLDAKFREKMRSELKKLHIDIGATTAYVTHDQLEAMEMGDRIAIMNLGVLQQVGTPNEIYTNPNNLIVANFIGSPGMNFVDCKYIKDSDGNIVLRITEINENIIITDKIKKAIVDKNLIDKDLVLGVRPEDIILSFHSKEKYIKTKVLILESVGSYNIIDINIGKNKIIKARTIETFLPSIGETVYVDFDMERVSFFNKETGDSILNKK